MIAIFPVIVAEVGFCTVILIEANFPEPGSNVANQMARGVPLKR